MKPDRRVLALWTATGVGVGAATSADSATLFVSVVTGAVMGLVAGLLIHRIAFAVGKDFRMAASRQSLD